MLGFGEPIKRGFRNNSTFSGRATRAENWWWVLFATIGSLVFGIVGGVVGLPGVLELLFVLGTLIPPLAGGYCCCSFL